MKKITLLLTVFGVFLTTAQTTIEKISEIEPLEIMHVYNDKLYFEANDGINGAELWVTDGTSAGTEMFKDFNPNGDSSPNYFIEYNDKIYFRANEGVNGVELWESDGTDEGTIKIAPPIATGVSPLEDNNFFTVFKDELYFVAAFDGSGRSLWKVSTPTASTEEVNSIKISLYPNPVSDQLHIQTQEEITQINLISFTGQLLQTWSNTTTLNISNYANGVYFLQINTQNTSTIEKIIKK